MSTCTEHFHSRWTAACTLHMETIVDKRSETNLQESDAGLTRKRDLAMGLRRLVGDLGFEKKKNKKISCSRKISSSHFSVVKTKLCPKGNKFSCLRAS